MRLCANENVPGDCVTLLRQRGHDVLWIREVARGASDDGVLAMAQSETRLLLTFDKDFGELVFRVVRPHGIGLAHTPSLSMVAFTANKRIELMTSSAGCQWFRVDAVDGLLVTAHSRGLRR
jgi:predicted nuclease of predicted toxin-antitoxin system